MRLGGFDRRKWVLRIYIAAVAVYCVMAAVIVGCVLSVADGIAILPVLLVVGFFIAHVNLRDRGRRCGLWLRRTRNEE